jgi:periplasmic divalent cation tolerance protein
VPDDYLQVTTTVGSKDEADALARELVEARLAACVQVLGPIASTYRWRGAVETAEEWLCLVKTTSSRFDALAAHLDAHHPYDVPELVATPVTAGSDAYLRWVTAETGA